MGPAAGCPAGTIYHLEYFSQFTEFTGSYRQHSAALKYFRDEHEDPNRPFESAPLVFSNSQPAAVAAVIWGHGESWDFDRTRMLQWSWQEMVAQLAQDSIGVAVLGEGGRSCGLVGCYLAPRPNSYDHKRHAKLKGEGRPQRDVRLPVWDFVLERSDGTAVRLHPQRSTSFVETFEVEGHAEAVEPPPGGYGGSWGHGTYKHYKQMNTRAPLRFDPNKGSRLFPGKKTSPIRGPGGFQ